MATVVRNKSILAKGNVSGGVSKAQDIIIKEVEFNSKSNFPVKGYHKYLYIATDENQIYRWDEEQGYVSLASEIDDISITTSSTWSSYKINAEINNVSEILDYATDEDIKNLF